MSDSGSDVHYAHAVNTAIEAVKSLLLVNGGAATALIALKTKGGADFGLPVLLFGLAALLNAFTLVLGYFSQLNYANSRAAVEEGRLNEARQGARLHRRFQFVAIIVMGLSLIASAGGMSMAFLAI